MARRNDVLKQFATLHRGLVTEREQLRQRLEALNEVLGAASFDGGPGPRTTVAPNYRADLGMREAIQTATASSPLGGREIVDSIQQLGFRFKSKNPYNSVGAYLYGKEGRKHFKKADGKFSPLRAAQKAGGSTGASRPAKRKLSAAGRRAIAEAAKKRWAAYNARKK